MTYYYAIFNDDYMGAIPVGSSRTLQNALKGLRKAMKDDVAPVGYIFDSPKMPNYPSSRTPKNLVGTMMQAMTNKRYKYLDIGGRKVKFPDSFYVYVRKGTRKEYVVMSDGRLVPYKKE